MPRPQPCPWGGTAPRIGQPPGRIDTREQLIGNRLVYQLGMYIVIGDVFNIPMYCLIAGLCFIFQGLIQCVGALFSLLLGLCLKTITIPIDSAVAYI